MTAEELFIGKDYNCAESVLRLADEALGLGICEEDMKLVGGFGGGFGCGMTCGALCGAVCALSKLKIRERAHEDPEFKQWIASFAGRFREHFGGCDCAHVKPAYFDAEKRCLCVVEETRVLLEEFLKES